MSKENANEIDKNKMVALLQNSWLKDKRKSSIWEIEPFIMKGDFLLFERQALDKSMRS